VVTAEHYFDDSDGAGHTLKWDKDFIQWHLDQLADGTLTGSYGREEVLKIKRHLKDHMDIKGKKKIFKGPFE